MYRKKIKFESARSHCFQIPWTIKGSKQFRCTKTKGSFARSARATNLHTKKELKEEKKDTSHCQGSNKKSGFNKFFFDLDVPIACEEGG